MRPCCGVAACFPYSLFASCVGKAYNILNTMYTHLNHDIAPDDPTYSDAWRRVLNRLGEYTSFIVSSLRVRPTGVDLLAQNERHLLLRIRMPGEYVVLRIAPEDDLLRELYFARTMVRHQLPVARVMECDLGRTIVPFAYIVEGYIGGKGADSLESLPLLESLARQTGRILRRMHRVESPGWGTPGPTGRWKSPDWRVELLHLHDVHAPVPVGREVFGSEMPERVAALVEDLAGACPSPQFMHSNIGPHAVRCTTSGEKVNLEALLDPGPVVGGDGLLDLAMGMDPRYPQEWRSGLYEGYIATRGLPVSEQARLFRLRALVAYWSACRCGIQSIQGEPLEVARDHALELLARV